MENGSKGTSKAKGCLFMLIKMCIQENGQLIESMGMVPTYLMQLE